MHLLRDRDTDKFKGMGFVEFTSRDDLERALDNNGAVSVPPFLPLGDVVTPQAAPSSTHVRRVKTDVCFGEIHALTLQPAGLWVCRK